MTRDRCMDLLVLAAALVMLAAAWVLPPATVGAEEKGFVVCRFKAITGLDCPNCGLTRSVVALAHGDARASFGWHPAGPLLAAAAAFLAGLVPLLWLRRKRPLWGRRGFVRALEALALVSLLGGVLRGVL